MLNIRSLNDSSLEARELFEVINYFLSNKFKERWRYRFSERFVTLFQLRVLKSLVDNRPLKMNTLSIYLNKKCSYSKDIIDEFFEAVDIDLLRPVVTGTNSKSK